MTADKYSKPPQAQLDLRFSSGRVSRGLIGVVVVVVAAVFLLRLIDGFRPGSPAVSQFPGFLPAVAFGPVTGMLAAANALVGCRVPVGSNLCPLDFWSRDALLIALFGLSVGIVALYPGAIGLGRKQSAAAAEPGGPRVLGTPQLAVGRSRRFVQQGRRRPIRVELRRGLLSLFLVMAGLTGAFALRGQLGLTGSILLALTSVLLVAQLMGEPFGLAAGLSVGAALNFVFQFSESGSPRSPIELAVNLLLFAALGWGAGIRSDQLRIERDAAELLANASRDLALETDETAIRRILFDSLRHIRPGGVVQLFDEHGVAYPVTAALASDQPVPRWGPNDPRWGTRRLEAEGRHVGAVRWAFPGSRRDRRDAELLAISLIELGASAIVRVRLRLEREETDYQARAEQLRTILLDAVSHHFRSPLTGIIGSVTSILNLPERHDPSVRNEFLLIIKEQANRLSRYVDNFFSLARLESNSVEIHITQLNFEALIYDVWDRFGDVGGARRYLVVEVEADPIWSDANLLGQIFGNILENAIKYSPEASVVRVVGRTEDGRLHVDTIDEGPGAPPASIGHMFERFYRSQGVKASGLGLGLYITRSLLEMLGGSVTARNRSDGSSGLVISVELPILEPQYAQQQ